MEVEVVFPYEPQHDDELRLNVGDVITNVTSLETGWYRGSLGNVNGVFPDNFVKVLSKEPKNASAENGLATTPPNVQKRDMGGRRCRVVFSYAPQHDDELPLCVGQTITILQEVEEGWWKGVLDGQVGMFPSNFVEDIGDEESTTKSTESNLENINNQLNVNGDQKEIKPKPVQGMGYGVKLTDLKKDVNNKKETDIPASNGSAKILGSSGSSAFQPVHKTKEAPKENGQVKDFRDLPHRLPPALEPKAERVTSKTDKTRINAADKERISSMEKDRITLTIGDEKPKNEQSSKKDHSTPAVNDSSSQPPPQLPPKPVRELARVMFPYAAEHEDELELKEGDIITVLCKELEDKGWWRGELGGNVGVFPDNFVELLTVEETAKPPRPEKPAAVLAKQGSPSSSADTTPTGTLNKADKEPPPPLPEKKVQAPPPPEKKPGVGPTASVDAHDGITSSKDQSENAMNKMIRARSSTKGPELNLSLNTDGERLKHVIRPKGPSRRPPSGLFKENMKNQTSADSDTLLATPEDDLEDESNVQANGHVGSNELSRSPSIPSLVHATAKSPTGIKPVVELRSRPESAPRSDTGQKDVPWLQELRLNQRKKVSVVFNTEENSGPGVSPKPLPATPKQEDKPVNKALKTVAPMPDSTVPDSKTKPSEPHIPNPDYESTATPPQAMLPRHKPQPRTPLSGIPFERKVDTSATPPATEVRRTTTTSTEPRRTTTVLPEMKRTTPVLPEMKRTTTPSEVRESKGGSVPQKDSTDNDNQMEDKVNAIYKELLPKIKMLEDRIEENRKQQSHSIQMLMSELDDERKKRACMEVEIERLKKLVNTYAQV